MFFIGHKIPIVMKSLYCPSTSASTQFCNTLFFFILDIPRGPVFVQVDSIYYFMEDIQYVTRHSVKCVRAFSFILLMVVKVQCVRVLVFLNILGIKKY